MNILYFLQSTRALGHRDSHDIKIVVHIPVIGDNRTDVGDTWQSLHLSNSSYIIEDDDLFTLINRQELYCLCLYTNNSVYCIYCTEICLFTSVVPYSLDLCSTLKLDCIERRHVASFSDFCDLAILS